MKGKNDTDTPGAKSSENLHSCDSTAAMTPMSQLTEYQEGASDDRGRDSIRHRRAVVSQLAIFAAVSSASFGAIVVLVLPFPALVALLTFLVSLSGTLYLCLHLFTRELQGLMQGRGIGDYLPLSIYNRLTELTLHEWMQDTSLTLEYRHLMLYFVPGITPERLDEYVDALSPRHRNNLRRRGLGHLLGDDFMRLIMGNERFRRHVVQNQPRPTELILPPSLPTEPMNDADSDLGSTCPDAVSPIETPQFSDINPRNRSVPLSRALFVDDEEQEGFQQEQAVLSDAVMNMVNTYMNFTVETMTRGFAYMVERATPYIFGTGVGITSIAVGIGVFGTLSGVYFPNGTVSRVSRFPSQHTLWTAAFIGGLSSGGVLLFRSAVRSMTVRPWTSIRTKSEGKKKM
jgi:hypothetical protein